MIWLVRPETTLSHPHATSRQPVWLHKTSHIQRLGLLNQKSNQAWISLNVGVVLFRSEFDLQLAATLVQDVRYSRIIDFEPTEKSLAVSRPTTQLITQPKFKSQSYNSRVRTHLLRCLVSTSLESPLSEALSVRLTLKETGGGL